MGDPANQVDDNLELDDEARQQPGEGGEAPEFESQVDVVDLSEKKEDGDDNEEESRQRKPLVKHLRERIRDQNKELKGHRQAESEKDQQIETLTKRLEVLESGQPAGGEPDGMPTLESCGYDTDEYQRKMAEWAKRSSAATVDERLDDREARLRQQAARDAQQAKIDDHYRRANELAVADYEAAEDAAAKILSEELVEGIQATAKNSEIIIYHLGKNPEKARKLRQLCDQSPAEFTFELGVLASNLSIEPRQSTAPDPDIPLKGGGGVVATAKEREWLKKLDAAYDSGDLNKVRTVRREAAADGVDLPYNRT